MEEQKLGKWSMALDLELVDPPLAGGDVRAAEGLVTTLMQTPVVLFSTVREAMSRGPPMHSSC